MWPLRPSSSVAFLLFIPRTKEKKMDLSTYFSAFAEVAHHQLPSSSQQAPLGRPESSSEGETHHASVLFASVASFRPVVFCLVAIGA